MRVDVHHHYFPSSLQKANLNQEVGWRTPAGYLPWSPEISLKCMDDSAIDVAILSFPALSSHFVGEENRRLTRQRNDELAGICKKYPTRFGFFASLPTLDDVDGALAEIAYALDQLKADGIAIPSSYGIGPDAKYIGHDDYELIWAELDRREAVVFLHGAQTPSSTPYPHEFLGLPISEVPNETYKAAAHLVVTGRKRKYSKVKIILSHMGGSTIVLAPRVAVLSGHMGCTLSKEEIIEDFKSFYFDTALAAYDTNLRMMETFVHTEKILFGSDIPAISTEMARWYTSNLEEFYGKDRERLDAIMHGNAYKLIPRLRASVVDVSTS